MLRRSRAAREPLRLRELLHALGLGALGLVVVPLAPAPVDPTLVLAWLAVLAPAAGWLAGATRLRVPGAAAVVPAAWFGLLVAADLASEHDLPEPAWAAAALAGLYFAGLGLGRASAAGRPGEGASGAAALLALGALLAAAPTAGGLGAAPWPPAVGARLLDLSPPALVAECAGLDWLRHPGVYAAAGSAHVDPSSRAPYRGTLAGPSVLVVGCALAALGVLADRRRRRRERAEPSPPLARPVPR